jgi:hypothetical protein
MAQNSAARPGPSAVSEQGKQQRGSAGQSGGQGLVRDERGQDQPADKERAQRTSGLKAQKDAAETQQQSPGQPAGGE